MSIDRYDFGGLLFTFTYKYNRLLRKFCADSGLYMGQPRILALLRDNPGCTLSELSELAGIGMPSLSVSVRNLKKSGLLRYGDNGHTRGREMFITEEGLAKLNHFNIEFDSFLQTFQAELGPERASVFNEELYNMQQFISRYSHQED